MEQEWRSGFAASVLSIAGMASIDSITLEVADEAAARRFYSAAFGLGPELQLAASDAPTSGFRGFTLSLTVSQPADATALLDAAVAAGATVLKPAAKSFWGFGGVVQAPDGRSGRSRRPTRRTPARRRARSTSSCCCSAPRTCARASASTSTTASPWQELRQQVRRVRRARRPVQLGLYGRRALAKDAGVAAEGSGSHRLIVDGGPFTDPDGFAWAPARIRETVLVDER